MFFSNFIFLFFEKQKMEKIDSYILFNTDEHLSEYPAESDRLIAKISGFNGSNAILLLSEKGNFLFTDGRYYIQAENELPDSIKLVKMEEVSLADKLKELNFKRIGMDFRTISSSSFESISAKISKEIENFEGKKIKAENFENLQKNESFNKNFKNFDDEKDIKFLDYQLFESGDRKFKKIFSIEKKINLPFLEDEKSLSIFNSMINLDKSVDTLVKVTDFLPGVNFENKIENILEKAEKDLIISDLGEIAYLFNLRGDDLIEAPFFYSYAHIKKNGECILFLNEKIENYDQIFSKKTDSRISVKLDKYENFYNYFLSLPKDSYLTTNTNYKISKDSKSTDIVAKMMSKKNINELAGFFQSGIDDGIFLVKLFNFLEKKIEKNEFLSEKEVADKLLEFKKTSKYFLKPSFETISGYGKNGAIIHHRPSNDLVKNESTYLIDSGSQYMYGTTDITRTLHFGDPKEEIKKMYTLVLRGQIWGKIFKTKEQNYKQFASLVPRLYLNYNQKDYKHGTGHGVGFVGNVHEFTDFKENSVFSVEPGFYKKEDFGIRIEDVVFGKKLEDDYLVASELTFVPYQKNLIKFDLIEQAEVKYLKYYNEIVQKLLMSGLNDEEKEYLIKNTDF